MPQYSHVSVRFSRLGLLGSIILFCVKLLLFVFDKLNVFVEQFKKLIEFDEFLFASGARCVAKLIVLFILLLFVFIIADMVDRDLLLFCGIEDVFDIDDEFEVVDNEDDDDDDGDDPLVVVAAAVDGSIATPICGVESFFVFAV